MVFKFSSYNGEVIRGRKDGWMKKRVIQLFLGIAVLSYVFTGCSHQGSTDDKETDSVNSGEVIVEEQEQDFIDQESQGSIELSGMLQVDGKMCIRDRYRAHGLEVLTKKEAPMRDGK